MPQPISLDRSLELQWDWPRICRNPLGNDAAFAAYNAVAQTASLAAFFVLDGRAVAGTNAYIKVCSAVVSAQQGYSLGYYTGAQTFTTTAPTKLGNTTAANQFIFASKQNATFFGTNFDQGSVLANVPFDFCRGGWIMVPAGSALLIQGSLLSSSLTVAMQWCEYSD